MMLLLFTLTVAMSGCSWEDDNFLGTWESFAYSDGYNEYELSYYERVTYSFYNDGTGFYVQNNGLRTQFYWTEYSRGHLYLRHSDGLTQDFYYRFDRGDMIMSESPGFYTYTVLRYRGHY